MNKGIRLRIYPNKKQEALLAKNFGCVRFVYNMGLSMRQDAYKKGEIIGYTQTCSELTKMKREKDFAFLKEADAVALQQSLRDLDMAFKNFFAKRSGYPCFKSKHSHRNSYRTINQCNHIRIENNHIKLPKIGWVKIKPHVEIKNIKYVTVEQLPSGKYYAAVVVDFNPTQLPQTNAFVGLDVGIKNYCATSNGEKISNPRYLEKSQKKLIKEQKKLSRKKEGSSNWNKQRVKVARIYEKVTNQQNDFLQKLSTTLISENQVICVENLNIIRMIGENHKLAQPLSSVSWSKFFGMLEYKADWYGRIFIKIPRFYPSSQICNICGYRNHEIKKINIREWICPKCGALNDRDYNAAKNILNKGLSILEKI